MVEYSRLKEWAMMTMKVGKHKEHKVNTSLLASTLGVTQKPELENRKQRDFRGKAEQAQEL